MSERRTELIGYSPRHAALSWASVALARTSRLHAASAQTSASVTKSENDYLSERAQIAQYAFPHAEGENDATPTQRYSLAWRDNDVRRP
jgi:hypothetical protein